jgi:GNAT superfamily N-acetyltransferase
LTGEESLANYVVLEKTRMQIRPAVMEDIEGVQAVGRSAWWDTYTGLRPKEYIQHALEQWWSGDYLRGAIESERHILLVAEEHQQIIGVVESQVLADKRAMLWKLYVLKEHRGKGVGTALIEESIRCLPLGIEVYYTEYDSKNEGAAAFYASRGFVFDKTEELDFQGVPVESVYVKRFLREMGKSMSG